MSIEKGRKNFVCEALYDIKALQDVITNFHSKYYGQLLVKIVGSDTIPLFLITNNGAHLRLLDTDKQFETEYFRIESIDKERCRGTISLLRAYDYEGNETNSIADVVKLERTASEKSIELSSISAIQLLNPDLLKKKILIEPKW
ncbi:CotY/CotZ family spore coat protein [Lysinibacillus sphaericus]|uniref:CotY/CotZ family spore coat protein n=1 Tax=Lysinibacillus sphaericus TaxID=1421 RepID=UPI001C5DAB6F